MVPQDVEKYIDSLNLKAKVSISVSNFAINVASSIEVLTSINELKNNVKLFLQIKTFFDALADAEMLKLPITNISLKGVLLILVWDDSYPLPSQLFSKNLFDTYCNIVPKMIPTPVDITDIVCPLTSISLADLSYDNFTPLAKTTIFAVANTANKNIAWQTFVNLMSDPLANLIFDGIPSLDIPPCNIEINVNLFLKHPMINVMLEYLNGTTVIATNFAVSDPTLSKMKKYAKTYGFTLKKG